MSTRKGTAKKSSVAETAAFYEEQEISDQIAIYELRLAALKEIYLHDMESAAKKKKQQVELESRQVDLSKKLLEKTEERLDILTDYTRQQKADERELIAELSLLDARHNALQEEGLSLQEVMQEKESELEAKIKKAKAEFNILAEKSEAMEKEFGRMLSDVDRSVKSM